MEVYADIKVFQDYREVILARLLAGRGSSASRIRLVAAFLHHVAHVGSRFSICTHGNSHYSDTRRHPRTEKLQDLGRFGSCSGWLRRRHHFHHKRKFQSNLFRRDRGNLNSSTFNVQI